MLGGPEDPYVTGESTGVGNTAIQRHFPVTQPFYIYKRKLTQDCKATMGVDVFVQSCPTLCDLRTWACQAPLSMGFSRQGYWSGLPFPSPMHESEKWKVKSLSRVRLLATPWTAAHQAPLSMGFSRQDYWSGVPLPLLISVYSIDGRKMSCFPRLRLVQSASW